MVTSVPLDYLTPCGSHQLTLRDKDIAYIYSLVQQSPPIVAQIENYSLEFGVFGLEVFQSTRHIPSCIVGKDCEVDVPDMVTHHSVVRYIGDIDLATSQFDHERLRSARSFYGQTHIRACNAGQHVVYLLHVPVLGIHTIDRHNFVSHLQTSLISRLIFIQLCNYNIGTHFFADSTETVVITLCIEPITLNFRL